MTDTDRPKGLTSAVSYQDAKAAFRWLEQAFGFEPLWALQLAAFDTDVKQNRR